MHRAFREQRTLAIWTDAAKATYRWGSKIGKHNFRGECGCSTYCESPDFSTGEPDYDKPKLSINARLFDNFDLDAVPVTVIDGKNLW